jgi:hypothetical protein
MPLEFYESSKSPIISSRVCEDCWQQIHGQSLSSSPSSKLASPRSVYRRPSSNSSSPLSSTVLTPPDRLCPLTSHLRRPPSRASSTSSKSRAIQAGHLPLPDKLIEVHLLGSEPSYGELDAYPLRRSSAICKATGGGRWEPKEELIQPCYGLPGCKAPFELEMEREEAEEHMRRSNPVVRDGGQ